MNIEEARRVLWLKSNPRPLGELLDEGYLTQERLEWAAQWAFNFKLQQAAKVILESMKSPAPNAEEKPKPSKSQVPEKSLEIGITLDKARATIWPFAPYKGQLMGSVVDSKQLTLKDLGWAAENAWDEKVRQAAIALSLVRLEQAIKEPVPDAGFVNVASGGRSYSERKQLWLATIEGTVIGFVFALAIAICIWTLKNYFQPHPNAKTFAEVVSSPIEIIAFIIALIFFVFIAWLIVFIPDQITKRMERQIADYRLGQEGEEQVVERIVQALDGNWHLFRNIGLPGRNKGDLDLVLVGPPGVWSIEVKNYHGEYRNIGDNWEYRHGNNWKKASKSPSTQVLNSAVRLANFLKADNLRVFVTAAVIWANPESQPIVENPSVAVWPYSRLADELGNIWQGEKLSEPDRTKIVDKLSKLCEEQRKARQ